MNRIFSSKTSFKIIIVILLILLGHQFFMNEKVKDYAYERIFMDLETCIDDLGQMNGIIAEILLDEGVHKKDYHIDNDASFALEIYDYKIKKVLNMDIYSDYVSKIVFAHHNIVDTIEDGTLNKEEKDYLKALSMYNDELINLYHEVIKKHGENSYDITHNRRKNTKNIYKEFCKRANKISRAEKYKILKMFRDHKEDRIREENIPSREAIFNKENVKKHSLCIIV